MTKSTLSMDTESGIKEIVNLLIPEGTPGDMIGKADAVKLLSYSEMSEESAIDVIDRLITLGWLGLSPEGDTVYCFRFSKQITKS